MTVTLVSWGGEALALRDQIALAELHSTQARQSSPLLQLPALGKKKKKKITDLLSNEHRRNYCDEGPSVV